MNIMLETQRLMLRRFSPDDWQDLFEYLSHKEVVKYEPYETFTENACKQEAVNRSGQDSFIAVCLKENNKLIGNIYFSQQEPKELLTWELGYVFNPVYYGKGYATEACRDIMDFAFKKLCAHRIVAMCNPDNTKSWELLERLNMRREGHLLQNIYFKNDENGNHIWVDTYEYAILSNEWSK